MGNTGIDNINKLENELFEEWAEYLHVSIDEEFVHDGLLFHDGLIYDSQNWVRTQSGNNSDNWKNSARRLLIITRDQPSDDGNIWDVRGETPIHDDGHSIKKLPIFKCLIPWGYASLLFDNETNGVCPDDDISRIGFWMTAPIARINCGKLSGKRVKDGGCNREKVVEYLNNGKDFILRQLKLYDSNIIMCCTGYDTKSNPVIDFIKERYVEDLRKIDNYVWYSDKYRKIIIDSYHFANQNLRLDYNKNIETINIRNAICEAMQKGCLI